MTSIEQLDDRISELPADIKRHILSLLTTREAIMTSALSKTWRFEWLSIPYLNFGRKFLLKFWNLDGVSHFNQDFLDIPNLEDVTRFLEFLHSAVISKRQTIPKIHLYIPPIQGLSPACLDGLIVNELEVDVIGDLKGMMIHDLYYVPKFVLSSNSLTKLYIQGCKLSGISINEFNLPSLRELSVSYVIMNQQMVDNLIASCTRVEKLSISDCQDFKSLQISRHPYLNHLEQIGNNGLELLEINTNNLRSLFHSNFGAQCKLVLSASCCYTITDMELIGCNIDDELGFCIFPSLSNLRLSKCLFSNNWLNRQLAQLLCLKVLGIVFSSGLKHYLQITLARPRSLILNSNTELKLYCSNLHDFSFGSQWNLTSLSSETRLLPASVTLKLHTTVSLNTAWDVKLIEMLKNLRQCKCLCIDTTLIENVIIRRPTRQRYQSPLCEIEELKVISECSVTCLDVTRSIEAMLWFCPRLKTLRIVDYKFGSPSSSFHAQHRTNLLNFLLKLNYKEPTELPQTTCGCYSSLPISCWRHSLRDFEIVEQQGFADDEGRVKKISRKSCDGNLNGVPINNVMPHFSANEAALPAVSSKLNFLQVKLLCYIVP